MNDRMLTALEAIEPSSLSYQEWINVGFALKHEGYPCSVWDDWSRNDDRWHEGECERKWKSFSGSATPITGATIFQMAREHGWKESMAAGELSWDDEISADGPGHEETYSPVKDLRTYLTLLFSPDDHVSYVTQSVKSKEGRWVPAHGGYGDRTAAELIASLDRYPDDLGATIGDWNPEAGAWIRFNALDGKGCRNDNVTSFKYALVESDSMSIAEQKSKYLDLNLPMAVLVSSGGKSLHAIVKVDAADIRQYRERVTFLYDRLKDSGVEVDRQNSNPSRLSRMPGVTRAGVYQKIIGTGLGASSWDEWVSWLEGNADDMPSVENLAVYRNNPPDLPPCLIEGVLRMGHKMLLSGSSKAGKSFLLMELAVSLAEGIPWLGFRVRRGRVLYVNLEIDRASCINRFLAIYDALAIPTEGMDNIDIWNLRGKAIPLDRLVPKLVRKMAGKGYEAVIIDPIYKVITGDENNASDMGAFCNQFDRICTETGCAAIYCHHHSKGAQGAKKAIDRASGSGVFARDPDAQLDIIELTVTDEMKISGGASAWRMEGSLREFCSFSPVDFRFQYPIHILDSTLRGAHAEGSAEANLAKSPKRTSREERHDALATAYSMCEEDGQAIVSEMAEYVGLSTKSIRRYIEEFSDEYTVSKSIVRKVGTDSN